MAGEPGHHPHEIRVKVTLIAPGLRIAVCAISTAASRLRNFREGLHDACEAMLVMESMPGPGTTNHTGSLGPCTPCSRGLCLHDRHTWSAGWNVPLRARGSLFPRISRWIAPGAVSVT
jgi:hypothetical protein